MNLSPRNYQIDVTGRDYTLDPAPLLRAQERNFASQKETMQMVYETGRQGVQFAEYLGARQQLGRVKAQISDIDPSDPDFARKYSRVVMENPLAFTNPNTGPVAKAALGPVIVAAKEAGDQRDALARIQAQFGSREAMQAARVQGQQDVWQYKQDHAPPTAADQMGLTNEAPSVTDTPSASSTVGPRVNIPVPGFSPGVFSIPGDITATPGVAQGVDTRNAQGVDGPDPSLFPQGSTGGTGPPLLPFSDQSGNDLTAEPLPPGVRKANDGSLWERKSVGKTASWVPYKVSTEKPTAPLPEGKVWVPELNPGTNDVKNWKAMSAPKESNVSQTQINNYVKRMGEEDPEMIDLSAKVDAAKVNFEDAKTKLSQIKKDAPEALAEATKIVELSRETLLGFQRAQVAKGVTLHNKALSVLDPKFVEAKRKFEAAVNGSDPLLETPTQAPTAVPAAKASVPQSAKSKLDAYMTPPK